MKTLEQLTKHHKRGGGGQQQAAGQTVVSTPPPPTNQSVEVQMAQRDAAKRAAKKKGLDRTILAGETGGYQPPGASGATVLGGASGEQKATVLGGT